MAIIQWIVGACLSVVSGLILFIGSFFAIPSMARYFRMRTM